MATYTTPDWLASARELAATSGVPERRVLEIMAGKIGAMLATAETDQARFHLSRDLDAIEARIRQLIAGGR